MPPPSASFTLRPPGAGVLGLPYALASLGWVFGLIMLTLATLTSAYSAWLLAQLHTLRDGRRVRTLRALGQEIFGRTGRRIISSLQFIDMVSEDVEDASYGRSSAWAMRQCD